MVYLILKVDCSNVIRLDEKNMVFSILLMVSVFVVKYIGLLIMKGMVNVVFNIVR